jgi:hypothetical protein
MNTEYSLVKDEYRILSSKRWIQNTLVKDEYRILSSKRWIQNTL